MFVLIRSRGFCLPLKGARQQGAVLIFGLLILTVLAIIGSTSADMGVVNQRIVYNSQQATEVFNAAETAGTYARNQSDWVNTALGHIDDPNFNAWPTYTVPNHNSEMVSEASVSASRTLLSGFSLNSGASVSYIRLEIEGGAARGTHLRRAVTQGWIRVGAG